MENQLSNQDGRVFRSSFLSNTIESQYKCQIFPEVGYLNSVQSEVQYRVGNPLSASAQCGVIAESEWLPFAARSIDLLVLPHVLEFSLEPHDVFRELSECIAPEGIVAITGVNPKSMLGVMKYFNRYTHSTLQQAKLVSVLRVRDWLSLLGFEAVAGEMVFFRPPSSQDTRLQRLQNLELAGARWWSNFGSVYVLVARKKEMAMRMNGNMLFRNKKNKKEVFFNRFSRLWKVLSTLE